MELCLAQMWLVGMGEQMVSRALMEQLKDDNQQSEEFVQGWFNARRIDRRGFDDEKKDSGPDKPMPPS